MDDDLLQDITNLAAKKGMINVLSNIWNKYKVLPNEEGIDLLFKSNPYKEEIKIITKWVLNTGMIFRSMNICFIALLGVMMLNFSIG